MKDFLEVKEKTDSAIIYGRTTIQIFNKKNNTTYTVEIEWKKFPEKFRYEETNITRIVISPEQGEDIEYEKGEWENIEEWKDIEEAVWEAFEN